VPTGLSATAAAAQIAVWLHAQSNPWSGLVHKLIDNHGRQG
jgi:hypothetical protein